MHGKLIEDFLLKHNLSLLNDGTYTYLHPATSSLSAIDLSNLMISTGIFLTIHFLPDTELAFYL